jgi:hypothetical protein
MAELDGQHGALALASEAGDVRAAAALAKLQDDMTARQRRVIALGAAIAAAEQQEAQREAEARAKAYASQVNAIRQHVRARDETAVKLTVAIENAVAAFRQFNALNEKIIAALPAGTPAMPADMLLHIAPLKSAIQQELFRAGHGPSGFNGIGFPLAFPGGALTDLRDTGDPDKLMPFEERTKNAGRHILDILAGSKPASPPAPIPSLEPVESAAAPEPAEAIAAGPKTDARGYVPHKVRLT